MTATLTTALPPFPAGRAIATLAAATLVAAGAVFLVLPVVGLGDQRVAAVAAAGVCFAAAVLALSPVRRASRSTGGLQRVAMATLLAFPLRVAFVAVGVSLLVTSAGLPVLPTVLWALVFYLVLLGVEVGIVVGYVNAAAAQPSIAPAPLSTSNGSPTHA